jgi:lysophospholipase L1-like esterase
VSVVSVEVAQVPEPPAPEARQARRLVVLGDSTAVGIGDPLPGGGWRGVGPLVAEALGVTEDGYLNLAVPGARMGCVRSGPLTEARAHRADIALVVVGMNDTLRSDFDAAAMAGDLAEVISALTAGGALAIPVRFHDHGRVFRLPGPLRRALTSRIGELNDVIDGVVSRLGVPCVDLGALPGAYELTTWSVDRLHPSELGHRLLATGFTDLVAAAGFAVASPVSTTCSGGASHGAGAHLAWLVVKGLPWLWRRGRDLVPYALSIMWRPVR